MKLSLNKICIENQEEKNAKEIKETKARPIKLR